jgi:hypothetical protein
LPRHFESAAFVDSWLEGLRALGPGSDLTSLVFPHGDLLHPDWDFVDACGKDAVLIVCEIFRLAHAGACDDAELESRKRLN